MSCHTCLFVKLDSDGVDIDGCLKSEIIEELRSQGTFEEKIGKDVTLTSRFTLKGQYVLNYEESLLDEKRCCEPFDFKSTPAFCRIRQHSEDFCRAREKAYLSYKQHVYDLIVRAERLSLAEVRRLYPQKTQAVGKPTKGLLLSQFVAENPAEPKL